MKKLLSVLGFLTITSTPFISPLQLSTSTEVVTNKVFNNYQLIELEQQKATIEAFGQYNKELYIGMSEGYLAKMNFDGKFTEISTKSSNRIDSIKEFNGALYFSNANDLLKMTADGEINKILMGDEYTEFGTFEVFNNELYVPYFSLHDYSSLVKIDSNGFVSKVFDFQAGFIPASIKTFNNHLYFAITDGYSSKIGKMDASGQIKEVTEINSDISHLIEFNNELYLLLDNGSLLVLDSNDKIKTVIERDLLFAPDALVVFRNELYIGNSKKLEKLTKDNKIETVVRVKASIQALNVFNSELYIGMNDGYFAKLI